MTETARERVWMALSELYLDTETDGFIAPCARVLAQSPFSRDELAQIWLDEVHPVLSYNLLAPAGVWDGFDRDWLCAEIRRQPRGWRARLQPAWWLRRADMRRRWSQLDAIIADLRSPAASD
ncbi:DUF7079 family protein [Arenimonas oryziterrae]|uniref:DUF7079 domain-containing protein n=1 Tax=Arenimonas oryziterrae DSM 21050 = YC6267 TaxID=1121015 RepID=A0A091BHN5_9GAMM|nr:hypothetical protein [Arenimonas oryziterrae]KFN43865.1 hypothetical protein N789_07920 [Arenimonas oryziterrae DSM 21050 = YC6267]